MILLLQSKNKKIEFLVSPPILTFFPLFNHKGTGLRSKELCHLMVWCRHLSLCVHRAGPSGLSKSSLLVLGRFFDGNTLIRRPITALGVEDVTT